MNKPTLLNQKILRTIGVFGIAVAATLLLVATVFSHGGYERSEPGRNEVVPEAPERVDVFFTQDVVKREGAFYVRVSDETETQVSDGDGVVDDDDRTHIYTELPASPGPGRYIVEWMTTSDQDGETNDGAFCFYVGVEPTADQEAECVAFDQGVPPQAGDDDDGLSTWLFASTIVAIVVAAAVVIGGLAWMIRQR